MTTLNEKEVITVVAGAFGIVLAFVGVIVLATFVNGFVIYNLWDWFVVPLGVKAITIPWAMGISLTAFVLTFKGYRKPEEKGWNLFLQVLLIRPTLWLTFGWIIHQMMT